MTAINKNIVNPGGACLLKKQPVSHSTGGQQEPSGFLFPVWFNGRTTDFGSVYKGSIPFAGSRW